MAISFREMPFHCPRTSCDGPFLGASFLAISCARLGTTANPIARDRPKIHCPFFIIFSPHSGADGPASISSTATPAAPCPRRGSTPRAASSALPSVPRSLMQSQLGAPADSRNDRRVGCVVGKPDICTVDLGWRREQSTVLEVMHEQVPRAIRSVPFLAFDLRDPRLHQFLNKSSRQGLVGGEQTAVVRKRGEPHQHSFVLERGNAIADGLGSLRWHSGPNRCANLVQGAAGGFRDTSKVFINVFRSALAFRRRTAIARFHFFHARNATRLPT